MEQEHFENADVVFVTDGECILSEDFHGELLKEQKKRRFTVTASCWIVMRRVWILV
mgnify:CR=1 FL=1